MHCSVYQFIELQYLSSQRALGCSTSVVSVLDCSNVDRSVLGGSSLVRRMSVPSIGLQCSILVPIVLDPEVNETPGGGSLRRGTG